VSGRKRQTLSGTGVLIELAKRLRTLRDQNDLTLRQLAEKSGYSTATLSIAEKGQQLPTWDVMTAFIQSCDDDPSRWRQLWEVAKAEELPTDSVRNSSAFETIDCATEAPEGVTPRKRYEAVGDTAKGKTGSGRSELLLRESDAITCRNCRDHTRAWAWNPLVLGGAALIVAIALSVIGFLVFSVERSSVNNGASPSALKSPGTPIQDGQDPYVGGRCFGDQDALERQPIMWPDRGIYGWLVLFYSHACGGAWGYVYGPNSPRWRVYIAASRPSDGKLAESSFRGQAPNNSWGNALSARPGCVRAEAWVNTGTDEHPRIGPRTMTSCWRP
jgi:transcriptional regulator with XRE-family HTH domain